jgi:hypothetical protein
VADVNFTKAVKALEGPAFVAVGFGVLGFQRAQVCRHAVQRRLASQLPPEAVELAKATGGLVSSLPGEARELVKEALAVSRFALQVVRAPVAKRATYP